ncbi:CaiB/BaiF CoA-transferase family protein [soil metagenome]
MKGPLAGITIIEFAAMGPVPFCATLLADMGANVVRIDREGGNGNAAEAAARIVGRGVRSIAVDLKSPSGIDTVRKLVASADALLEGFRPGVMERLGLGPAECLQSNQKLVYARMTGWGQTGPLAPSAGHDINYIALTGALASIGPAAKPIAPLNLLGDYGGGAMMMAFALVSALLDVRCNGASGQVLDIAMTDAVATLMMPIYGLKAAGSWNDGRASNTLDGGAPFYDTYCCADGLWISIGALEPPFFKLFLDKLGLDVEEYGPQRDKSRWLEQRSRIAATFASQPRSHWCQLLEGTDVCFAPILAMEEVEAHPHNAARGTFIAPGGVLQPAPAVLFDGRRCDVNAAAPVPGQHTREIREEFDLD